jgi:hypothetical protein
MVGVVAFVGAVLGSALGYFGAARATRVERLAREREEWGRRFAHALDLCLSGSARAQATGTDLLVVLSESRLASEDDRRYADVVIDSVSRSSSRPRPRTIGSESQERTQR